MSDNPFAGFPKGYTTPAAVTGPATRTAPAPFGHGGPQRPPPPSLEGLGNTELTTRNPGVMQDFKAYYERNPSAPTEYAFEVGLTGVQYFTPNTGDPTFIPTFVLLKSDCPTDPVGAKRIVFMSGSYDPKKGGLERLQRPLLKMLLAMLGIGEDQRELVDAIKPITGPFFMGPFLQDGILIGGKVDLRSRLNAKGYIDHVFSPNASVSPDKWSPQLAAVITGLTKGAS